MTIEKGLDRETSERENQRETEERERDLVSEKESLAARESGSKGEREF